MKVETKFNVTDHIYFIKGCKVHSAMIDSIVIDISYVPDTGKVYTDIKYHLFGEFGEKGWFNEKNLFRTKEELIESL